MCDDLRFQVEIENNSEILARESVCYPDTIKLAKLAYDLRIIRKSNKREALSQWLVEVEPSPTGFPHILPLIDEDAKRRTLSTSLADMGVVADSVLRFVRISTESQNETTPSNIKAIPKSRRGGASTKKRRK
jgi:hypothetical protein